MTAAEELVALALRAEAKYYPGDEECEDRCVQDEHACMEANVHMQWSVNGVIRCVIASPDRIGVVAAAALSAAGRLLPGGGEERTEWRVVYRDGLGHRVVWSGPTTTLDGDSRLKLARRQGWPDAVQESRTVRTFSDGSVLTGPWNEVTE